MRWAAECGRIRQWRGDGTGDKLMAEALGAMLAGQGAVYKKLPMVGRRGAGGQREHQSSPVYVELAQEMGMAVGLARLVRGGTRVNWLA